MASQRGTGKQSPAELQQMLAAAVQHQAAGRLGEAASLCRKVLSVAPKTPPALHLLGLIEHRAGRSREGARLIANAVAINPKDVAAQNNLGLVLLHLDENEKARQQFQKALRLNPNYAEALNNLGTYFSKTGDHDQAIRYFRQALEKKPAYPEALNNLGNALCEHEEFEDAVLQYRAALKLRPPYADAMANLGHALTRLGRVDEGMQACRDALAINPRLPKAMINLGNAHQEIGNYDEAESQYRKALEIDGKNALAFLNLGKVARGKEKFGEAVDAFETALSLDPKPATLSLLAQSLIGAGDPGTAEARLRAALETDPSEADLMMALGLALTAQGRMEEGIEAYGQAISANPGHSEAHNNLGTALVETGQIEKATESFRAAIKANPDNASALRHLAMARKFRSHDEDVDLLEALYDSDTGSEPRKMLLGFALGKIHNDLRDPDKAFPYLAFANAARRRSIDYSIDTEAQNFAAIKSVFNRDFLHRFSKAGHPDQTPVFIIGMPRSGTTLVEQILASHPQVFGAGELQYLAESIGQVFAKIGDSAFKEAFSDPAPALFAETGRRYIDSIRTLTTESPRITDKMPANFLYTGLIPLVLPNAKIIHCRRNPVDTCFSIFMRLFTTGQYFSYDQNELGQYYRLYQDLMAHWQTVMPSRMHTVRYEDMVEDPEENTRKLLSYCDLEWDEACLAFHKTKRTVKTASATQVREPMYKDSVQAWRKYEHHLQPLLEALGDLVSLYDQERQ